MSMLLTSLLVVQVISALSIIVLVLLQQGKGADMGSSFGSGSAGSLFGATGAANFLSRTTKWCAVVFFVTTAGLAYLGHNPGGAGTAGGVMQDYDRSVPQVPGGAAPQGGGDASVPDAGVPQAPAAPEAAPPAQPEAPAPSAATPQPQAQPAPEAAAPAQEGAAAPAGQPAQPAPGQGKQ